MDWHLQFGRYLQFCELSVRHSSAGALADCSYCSYCASDDCHISTVLMIATYPLFCNPVDHFAQTFRCLWSLQIQSNESCHLLFVMLWKKLGGSMITRQEMREMLTAHLASGLLPIFTSKSSPQKSGGNPHHVTTHKSASAGAVATTHPHHVKPCESCAARQQINGFHNIWQH